MSQFPTLERFRPLLRIEVGVLLVLLVVAAIWFSLYQKVGDAEEAEATAEQQLVAIQSDINAFIANNQRPALEEQIQELQSDLTPLALPSLAAPLQYQDAILSYIDTHGVLIEFREEETFTPLGEEEFPTIRYSVRVQGTQIDLVDMLEQLRDFPSTKVDILEMVRSLGEWEMTLELSVFHVGDET